MCTEMSNMFVLRGQRCHMFSRHMWQSCQHYHLQNISHSQTFLCRDYAWNTSACDVKYNFLEDSPHDVAAKDVDLFCAKDLNGVPDFSQSLLQLREETVPDATLFSQAIILK